MGTASASYEHGARTVAPRIDRVAVVLGAASLLLLYVPVVLTLNTEVWGSVEQSYGPVILGASLWFFWQKRQAVAALATGRAAPAWGFGLIGIALLLYVLGRTQQIMMIDVFSAIPMCIGLLLLLKGWQAVRLNMLALALLCFVIPLPPELVAALTGPLKSGVSQVVEWILWNAGYPIARTGVVLTIGHYQLLVADACAGLTSIFTLETVGLIYMGIKNYASRARNVALALLLLPVSFVSNVIRVLILVLITFHFGDEVGQGFVHYAAGLLLFFVALLLMLGVDDLLGRLPWRAAAQSERP